MAESKKVERLSYEVGGVLFQAVPDNEEIYYKFVDFTNKSFPQDKLYHRTHTITWTETSKDPFPT